MDFKIERPSQACSVCSRPFHDGEELTTALLKLDDVPTFRRRDICAQCFAKHDVSLLHCYWANTFSERRRSPLLDSDALWQVFHRSFPKAGDDRQAREFAYVAALGLMRLKHLVLESTRRTDDGQEYLILRTRGKNNARAEFEVRDPNLDEHGIERVQERLADFDTLSGDVGTGEPQASVDETS